MTSPASVRAVEAGLFGKLPSRGDFIQLGLPGSFVRPWDAWLQRAMAASQAQMGDDWLAAYLESPVWRFVLPGGMCGAGAAVGLLMPSVDRVGRYYPLTLAAVFSPGAAVPSAALAGPWLEVCETAGRAALDDDTPPDQVAEQVAGQVPLLVPAGVSPAGGGDSADAGVWWTDGGPRVAATSFALDALPEAEKFIAMLGAGVLGEGMLGVDSPVRGEA